MEMVYTRVGLEGTSKLHEQVAQIPGHLLLQLCYLYLNPHLWTREEFYLTREGKTWACSVLECPWHGTSHLHSGIELKNCRDIKGETLYDSTYMRYLE